MNKKFKLAVCGLHMKNFLLNKDLISLNAQYLCTAKTAPIYKLYALNTQPAKPGLIRTESAGYEIEVEIYEIDATSLGIFLSTIPSPLGLGKLLLKDNTEVIGFICEPYALDKAVDISEFGGWRGYTDHLSSLK